jgi:transcriptional regulator with XRE-family HTH domain
MMRTTMKDIRQARRWSQRRLARWADISEADASRIETGRMRPYPGQARRIARALGKDVNELFPDLEMTTVRRKQ